MSIKQANEHRNEWFEGVHKCKLDDTLFTIMDKIVRAEVNKVPTIKLQLVLKHVISI